MSDIPQTPEAVAHQLMVAILSAENGFEKGREYILSTFVECIKATKGEYEPSAASPKPQQNQVIQASGAEQMFPAGPKLSTKASNPEATPKAA